ncbi:IclR family transcriptional regulator [Flavobacterium collinsii]|uniref:uracil-DNA glycosylase family protein n=1 Tax=Flavobacterium collinsii TaxID=1114861 RepID=UPI0022C02A3E|nr:uracil-DNA glycosylase family protein [Flavobacterium collinsii]GIQ60252.1 IclR family transcriptional regulator [Flavobacterium collinsii]
MEELLEQIKNCRVCEDYLKDGVNPVVAASRKSKIVIIGQAPGRIVHNTNIAWNDKSGDNLRNWLQIDKTVFYNTDKIALMPMGFCFPGTGKTGDLPPRPECAPLWHEKVLKLMPDAELVLLVGQYSQKYYLGKNVKSTLTETVQNFEDYLPYFFPLPHPSPRNNIWQAKNEWFQDVVLPQLREKVKDILRE